MARQNRSLKRTALIAVACVIFLCSVGFMRIGLLSKMSYVWPCFLALEILIYIKISRKLFWVVLAASLLGVWRGEAYLRQLASYQALYNRQVIVTAQASEDAAYNKNSQLSFTGNHVILNGKKLAGKMQISGFGLNAIYQGDLIRARGKMYPGFGASQGSVSYGKLELIARHPSFFGSIRQKFTSGITSALPEPLASFAMGLLIGQRATLPDGVKRDLLMVGLTHIIAVSGYNLTIMLRASQRIFIGHSKRLGLVIAIVFIGFFLAIAGSSASIVRAAIVSTLSIIAGYNGRHFKPANLILLAAAATAFSNPFYIWGDMSWYLSFLAFAGVMLLAPMLGKKLNHQKEPSILTMVALETICAEIMTIPIILFTFGQMSLVGLPANLLVVTLVPLAMLLSSISGLAGMFLTHISGWFAWPTILILNFMLDTAHIIASLPHVFLQNISFSVVQMIVAYIIIGVCILLLPRF